MIQCETCGRYAVVDYIPLSSGGYCSYACVPHDHKFLMVDNPTRFGFLVVQKPEVKAYMAPGHDLQKTSFIHHYVVDGKQLLDYREHREPLKPLLKFRFHGEAPTAKDYSVVFAAVLPISSTFPVDKFHYTDKEAFQHAVEHEDGKLYGFTKSYPDLTDLRAAMREHKDEILRQLVELAQARRDRWSL